MKRIPLASAVAVGSIAAALAFGTNAFDPVIAGAQPNNGSDPAQEWDIKLYDSCIKMYDPGTAPVTLSEWDRYCCDHTGGVWNGSKCEAPAGEPAQSQPTRQIPPGRTPTVLIPVPS